MKVSLTYLDTCGSDYFQGYSGTSLAVPVYRDISREDLIETIMAEWETVEECEELTFSEMEKAVESFVPDMEYPLLGKELLPTLKQLEGYTESIYMYIGVVREGR